MFRKNSLLGSLTTGVKESFLKSISVREQKLPLTVTLFDFNKNPNEIDNLIAQCDQDLGGYSTVHFDTETDPVTQRKYGHFHGILNLDPPLKNPEVKYSGWSMFRTKHKNNFDHRITYLFDSLGNFKWDLSAYTALKLRVKIDHRKYFVNLQIDDPQKFNLFQHRLFAQTPGEWETVYVPLDDFVLTNKGRILKQHHGELNREKVKSVGIGLIDRTYGPYSLCIESIELITDFDLLDLLKKSRQENVGKLPPEEILSIED